MTCLGIQLKICHCSERCTVDVVLDMNEDSEVHAVYALSKELTNGANETRLH